MFIQRQSSHKVNRMATTVNSKKKRLDSFELMSIAIPNMGTKYPLDVAMGAILTEFAQPNSEGVQIGNTLFSVLVGKNRQGVFKAFNADTAANFVENSKEFTKWAYDNLGLDVLVVDYESKEVDKLIRLIARGKPKNQGVSFFKMKSGRDRAVIRLGTPRSAS